jgi:hypothetical protein
MSKEIEKKDCHYCESHYKVVFDLEETNGGPRFCPFCGEECYDDEKEIDDDE